jgi:pyridoxine 5-phosphate synthase
MDPLPAAMSQIRALGADRIELYTEPYAANFGQSAGRETLDAYVATAAAATSAGLGINAGHDLNLHNLPNFVAAIPALLEVSIGHALVADALEFGLAKTVHLYLEATGNVPLDAA